MSDYFDELESELRAAVPRTAHRRGRDIFPAMTGISLLVRRGLRHAAFGLPARAALLTVTVVGPRGSALSPWATDLAS
jgi:hypothetical protein